ncbi:MAG: phosphate ABC transporter permease subunit PstC [Acholeplasmataceae bacterium]|nr:phosphate ABC transporter permease subunit PstC [Acholeplasmataceae bacterium]
MDIRKSKNGKNKMVDVIVRWVLFFLAILSSSFIFMIVGVILFEGITPFISDNGGLGNVNFFKFITGDVWLRGEAFNSNLYSVGFIIISTMYIAFLSLLISFPIGVLTALFIAKIAPKKLAESLRTVTELLASIPSIIYGLFGAGLVLKVVYELSALVGYQSKGGNSVLSTVIVLAIMTIPTITSISEVAIRSVDKEIIHGSLALGASPMQTNFKVVLSAAKSGIFTSAILGIGRVLGEATAVSLVAGGRRSGLSFDILDTTSTLTTTMLEGMKETAGLDYDIRFSVGIILMIVILLTNLILNIIKRKVGHVDVK